MLLYGSYNVKEKQESEKVISSVNNCKYLGVLRSNFSYKEHARNTALKAAWLASMKLKVFNTQESTFLRQFFASYLHPTLEYAAPVWSPSSMASRGMLEKVQHRFTKRMKGYENISCDERFTSFNINSLARRRRYHNMLLVFKASHGFAFSKPKSFGFELSRAPPIRRGGNRFNHEKLLNSVIAASFRCRTPKKYDTLPDICINSSTLSGFKTSFAKYFKPDFTD